MQRFGYLQRHITVAELMNKSDYDLFCKLCAPTHALNHLLPPTRNRASLRTRGHSYIHTGKEKYLRPFIHIGLDWIPAARIFY